MAFVEAMRTSDRDDWETPPELFKRLDAEFNFTLDPCCTPQTAKCDKFFTRRENGLVQDWGNETVFVNPPYGSQLGKWVRKSFESSRRGATVVMLIPSRTDTAYFHDYVYAYAEIRFLRGRIYFYREGSPVGRAPFPSLIAIFRPEIETL